MLKEFIEHIQKTTQPLITTVNGSTFRITDDGTGTSGTVSRAVYRDENGERTHL